MLNRGNGAIILPIWTQTTHVLVLRQPHHIRSHAKHTLYCIRKMMVQLLHTTTITLST